MFAFHFADSRRGMEAFKASLSELGYVGDDNVVIDFRWVELPNSIGYPPTGNGRHERRRSARQYRALPGVLGKGMASRTLARPVT
jgi:hypothetical protein